MKNLKFFAALIAAASLLPLTAGAQQTPQPAPSTGFMGQQNASTPNVTPPAAAPVSNTPATAQAPAAAQPAATAAAPAPVSNSVTTTNAPAPAGATTTDTQKVDPCKDYMYDMNMYSFCQDRYLKIERLKNSQKSRDAAYLPPPPPAPVQPVAVAPVPAPAAAQTPPAGGSTPATGATPAESPAPTQTGSTGSGGASQVGSGSK